MSILERLGRASRARAEAEMKSDPLGNLEELIERLPVTKPFGARLTRAGATRCKEQRVI